MGRGEVLEFFPSRGEMRTSRARSLSLSPSRILSLSFLSFDENKLRAILLILFFKPASLAAELMMRKPLFCGKDFADQIRKVIL